MPRAPMSGCISYVVVVRKSAETTLHVNASSDRSKRARTRVLADLALLRC